MALVILLFALVFVGTIVVFFVVFCLFAAGVTLIVVFLRFGRLENLFVSDLSNLGACGCKISASFRVSN